jgi:hypothetical protein
VSTRQLETALRIAAVLLALAFLYAVHHTRTESFDYRWYPDESYAPARQFPEFDIKRKP